MKVGVVTIPDYSNYGNRLQNYAVHHILRNKFGCEAVSLVSVKEKAFYDGDYRAWLKERVAKMFCIIPSFAEKRWGSGVTRSVNFHKWSKRNITTKFFYKHPALPESLNEEYDMFFAGSDQIWNYRFQSMKYDDYFLKFANDRKRAALCGSFGVETIPEDLRQTYSEGLLGFAHISVRENAGAALVKDLIGREVPVLVDPVMLLSRDEWLKVSRKPRVDISKPYILKYYLGNTTENNQIDLWAKKNGYEIYELLNKEIPSLYSAGPGEFISLIANSSLVVSDSFHCIVFSMIFKKPFIAYARGYMNSRIDTLLEKFGLQDRWEYLLNPNEYLLCDHTNTDEIIMKEQEKAFSYLQDILDSI